jgi:hypothetical protein
MDASQLESANNSNGDYQSDREIPSRLRPSDYSHNNKSKKRPNYQVFGIILIVIILVGTIAFGYQHYHKKSVSTTSKIAKTMPLTSQISLPAANQQYYSTNLSIGFNYPKNWTITDVTGSNSLTLMSPVLNLLTSTNKLVKGQITLTIQNQSPVIPGYQSGNATAALESQIIDYTNPTAAQRGSTYISFLHYATSNTPSSNIDAIYVTGNAGYKINQYIPETDILAVSPVVSITFSQCTTVACTGKVSPISITSGAWSTSSFSGTLLTLLKSLSIS